MRKAPHPLAIHLGMVAANMSDIQRYASNFTTSISEADAVSMVRGIKAYQEHEYIPQELPHKVIWSDGNVKIKKPAVKALNIKAGTHPLLLIPSLINKSNILDISKERSMLRWFSDHGIEAYLLDWGDISAIEDMDTLIKDKLCKAIIAVSKMSGKPIDVLGYCMGGTLLLPSYIHASKHIRRMVLLAAPWDFSVKSSGLAQNVRIWSPAVLPVIEQRGCLPSEWVQALFASLDPNGSAQKFIRFASMDQDSLEAKLFVSVEDWLNDGVDLPKNIAQHSIQNWFINNEPHTGVWNVAGKVVNTENISADILVIASKSDKLVSFDCAANIQKNLGSACVDIVELNCGHIGLIVGRNAVNDVWTPILNWLSK